LSAAAVAAAHPELAQRQTQEYIKAVAVALADLLPDQQPLLQRATLLQSETEEAQMETIHLRLA
jgi:hypothetical protein